MSKPLASVHIDRDVHARLKIEATARGMTLEGFLAAFLVESLERLVPIEEIRLTR